jgi:hypothetical protein
MALNTLEPPYLPPHELLVLARQGNHQFRKKHNRKMAEGKHHNSAIYNVSKNMINTVLALLKTKESFCFQV